MVKIKPQTLAKKLNTVADWLDYTAEQFTKPPIYFGHGTDNAWDEAVFLVLHVLQLPYDSGSEVLDTLVTQAQQQQILELINKRIVNRIPLAYLIREAWFAGLPFYVDERVLIPRSPLAELINNKFEPWIASQKVQNILDIGTGSGCIAIACAYNFPQAKVDATDLSSTALEVAAINIEKHQKSDQIKLIQSDIFSAIPKKRYDIIISNPPYVAENEVTELPVEYSHEPYGALAAGVTGLDFVERILADAQKYLSAHGILLVEVGLSAEALIAKYPELPFVWLEFSCGESEIFLLTRKDLSR